MVTFQKGWINSTGEKDATPTLWNILFNRGDIKPNNYAINKNVINVVIKVFVFYCGKLVRNKNLLDGKIQHLEIPVGCAIFIWAQNL